MYFLVISFIIIAAVISSISDASIKIYCDNSLCGEGPTGSLTELSINVSSICTNDCLTCKGKDNTKCENSTEYYPIQYCVEVRNTHNCSSDVGNFVKDLLVHLDESINSYPAGCLEILQKNNLSTSVYYTIRLPNGALISVYCDMGGSNCDGKGGWMRVGYLNMSEPGATCPLGLRQRQYNNIDHDVCGLSDALTHAFFSTRGIYYNKVCGQLRGYQYRAPDAFGLNGINDNNIDSCYVDGISITYGSSPRKHIWTYACGITFDNIPYPVLSCPCNSDNTEAPKTKPNFIGDDYYCESGIPTYDKERWRHVLYVNDPLWDGQQCDGNEGPCCTNPKMPWFIKTLNKTTTENIELRVCGNEGYPDEDIPLDIIELYIK